jgi:DNA-binding response OmpR family regulator
MRDKGEIVSRDKIMRALWEDESFVDDNTLTVNINRLRKKLEDLGLVDYIQTKKGQGYVIL